MQSRLEAVTQSKLAAAMRGNVQPRSAKQRLGAGARVGSTGGIHARLASAPARVGGGSVKHRLAPAAAPVLKRVGKC